MHSPCEPASIMQVDGALLAIEIEPAVAVEHRRHDWKYTFIGPLNGGVCHDHFPFLL